jgi:hypothetical protein
LDEKSTSGIVRAASKELVLPDHIYDALVSGEVTTSEDLASKTGMSIKEANRLWISDEFTKALKSIKVNTAKNDLYTIGLDTTLAIMKDSEQSGKSRLSAVGKLQELAGENAKTDLGHGNTFNFTQIVRDCGYGAEEVAKIKDVRYPGYDRKENK